MSVVTGAGGAKAGVPARIDFPKTVDQRNGPGPRTLVARGVEAELGEIERGRLQRQRNVDRGSALVDRQADIDARRNACAEPCDAAPGLPMIADEIALRAGSGLDSVGPCPGPEARRVGRFGGTTTGRIAPQCAAETIGRLVSKALQEIAAEIRHGRAGRQIGIDDRWRRTGTRRRRRSWRRRWRLCLDGRRRSNGEDEGDRSSHHKPATGPGFLRLRKPRWAAHERHFQKAALARQEMQNATGSIADLRRVPWKRQPTLVLKNGRLPHIVVAMPQVIRALSLMARFPELRQKLANAQNSCCNIRHNRI